MSRLTKSQRAELLSILRGLEHGSAIERARAAGTGQLTSYPTRVGVATARLAIFLDLPYEPTRDYTPAFTADEIEEDDRAYAARHAEARS